MTYIEFIDKLKCLGYRESINKSCGWEFHTWYYSIYDGKVDEVLISYMIDEFGKVRQQFGTTEHIVERMLKIPGYAGPRDKFTYKDCIDELMKNGYGEINTIRDIKLRSILSN